MVIRNGVMVLPYEYHTQSLDLFKQDFTESGWNRLTSNLNRIRKGNTTVLITPLAKREGVSNIYKEWDAIFSSNSSLMNDNLLELEMKNKAKFGPRSIAKPWSEIEGQTRSSFEIARVHCGNLVTNPPFSNDIGSLRPIGVVNSARLTRSNTSAGCPTMLKKGAVRDYTLDDFQNQLDRDLPMVPFIRTQEQEKTRLVYGYPYVDVIQENRYFTPLFDKLAVQPCFAGFRGPDAVNTSMTELIHEASRLGYVCVSGDIENFDNSVGYDLQKCAFDEIAKYFQPNYHPEIEEIFERFNSKPLITPDSLWNGSHGIPSGSNFTGVVGSLVNRMVNQQPLEFSQFLGDDFGSITSDVEQIFGNYTQFNLKLNRDKTLVKPSSFVYLQRQHDIDYIVDGECKGIYPTWRALNRLIHPESFSNFNDFDLSGRDYFAIRGLSILENCKYHPLFEEFVKFWLSIDKYKVPSNKGISSYVKMMEYSKGSLGTTNQYGDDIRGIKDFESYKLALRYS